MERLAAILTVAGSDSGGGAGIQADLKTITMLGGYGASVITALTAQNTKGVEGIHECPADFVALQLKAVLTDIKFDAMKTGMLFSAPVIKAVAPFLSKVKFPVVVDPVCISTSGHKLLKDDAVEAMVDRIFPHATLLTPNLPEAEFFSGIRIRTNKDVEHAAKVLMGMGPGAVLIKGGHSDSPVMTDWLMSGDKKLIPFMQPRIKTANTHGTGCTLSAAIATSLGQGATVASAIRHAQHYLGLALRAGFEIGAGSGPPNHGALLFKERARTTVLDDMEAVRRRLENMQGLGPLLPRSPMNVAVALPFADCPDDVAGFHGGVVADRNGQVTVCGRPGFGASVRTASALLAGMRLNPGVRCAATLAMDDRVRNAVKRLGWGWAGYAPDDRPEYIQENGGPIEEWGVFQGMSTHPDPATVRCILVEGGKGRSPLIHFFASTAEELQVMFCDLVDALGVD